MLSKIDNYFKLNPSSIDDPDIYLGGNLKKNINSICYHAVSDSVVMSYSLTGNVGTG